MRFKNRKILILELLTVDHFVLSFHRYAQHNSPNYIPVPPGGLPRASPPCSLSTLFAPVPAVSLAALPMSASARFRIRPRNRSTRMFEPSQTETLST